MTTRAFYRTTMTTSGEQRRDAVTRSIAAVFHALRDRLTMNEADQLRAQLPAELKALWDAGEKLERRPVKLDREQFYERVRQEAGLTSAKEARGMTLAVFTALREQLSPGEAGDVMAQLPGDLKQVWEEAEARPGGADHGHRSTP